jgi:hypothetical protein
MRNAHPRQAQQSLKVDSTDRSFRTVKLTRVVRQDTWPTREP